MCAQDPALPTRERVACWRGTAPTPAAPMGPTQKRGVTAMSTPPEFVRDVVCSNLSVSWQQACFPAYPRIVLGTIQTWNHVATPGNQGHTSY